MSHREVENMFSSSIEVLDCLLTQYEDRLSVQNEDRGMEGNNGDKDMQVMFEEFYNRLRYMLQTVCEKVESMSSQYSHKQEEIMMLKTLQFTQQHKVYSDSLFPQTKTLPLVQAIEKPASTDQQLYQLVVELKQKSTQDEQKITSLNNTLVSTQKHLKMTQLRLQKCLNQLKQKQLHCETLNEQFKLINDDKQSLLKELSQKKDQIEQLIQKSRQTQLLLSFKQKQIDKLEKIAKLSQSLQITNQELEQKISQTQEMFNIQHRDRLQIQEQLKAVKQQFVGLSQQNKRLKNNIGKKLSILSKASKQNRQNQSPNIKSAMTPQAQEYIKTIIASLMKEKKLIQSTVEKQLSNFVSNIVKYQGYQKTSNIPAKK